MSEKNIWQRLEFRGVDEAGWVKFYDPKNGREYAVLVMVEPPDLEVRPMKPIVHHLKAFSVEPGPEESMDNAFMRTIPLHTLRDYAGSILWSRMTEKKGGPEQAAGARGIPRDQHG